MRKFSTLIALAFALALPVGALAHGTLESSVPEADSTVDEAPSEVTLTLAEEPAPGSRATVTDGCKKDVGQKARLSGNDMIVAVGDGQPGRWNVEYSSISAQDGHEVNGELTFVVKGRKDCSAPDETPAETPGEIEPSTSSSKPIENPDEGSSFPVVPLAVGTVVVVGGALLLRRGSSGS